VNLNLPEERPDGVDTSADKVAAAQLLRQSLQLLEQPVPGWVAELADSVPLVASPNGVLDDPAGAGRAAGADQDGASQDGARQDGARQDGAHEDRAKDGGHPDG
jgi:hypothetical protein